MCMCTFIKINAFPEDMIMQRKKYYQFILIGLLLLDIVVSILYYVWYLDRKIPANINIIEFTIFKRYSFITENSEELLN